MAVGIIPPLPGTTVVDRGRRSIAVVSVSQAEVCIQPKGATSYVLAHGRTTKDSSTGPARQTNGLLACG